MPEAEVVVVVLLSNGRFTLSDFRISNCRYNVQILLMRCGAWQGALEALQPTGGAMCSLDQDHSEGLEETIFKYFRILAQQVAGAVYAGGDWVHRGCGGNAPGLQAHASQHGVGPMGFCVHDRLLPIRPPGMLALQHFTESNQVLKLSSS